MHLLEALKFYVLDRKAGKASLVSRPRRRVIYEHLNRVKNMQGSAAELGVYRGGTAYLIANILKGHPIHLFDTFTGIPVKSDVDYHQVGDFSETSLPGVKQLLRGHDNVEYHVGFFPDTASGIAPSEEFCFVHLDGDQYQSTLDGLKYFYPRMKKGGGIILDDYKWPRCEGVERAINEFLADKPEKITVETEYQAVLVKA